VVLAGQGFGDVEAAHPAEFLFLLEEKELVRLHVELPANGGVVVDNDILDLVLEQNFACRETGRPSTNYGHGGFVHLSPVELVGGFYIGGELLGNLTHLFYPIDGGDANALDLAIDQHLAGATLSNTALETPFTVLDAMAMNREARLMQGCSNGKSLLSVYQFPLENEGNLLPFWHFENRMFFNFMQLLALYERYGKISGYEK
jgi:hypothetical protein